MVKLGRLAVLAICAITFDPLALEVLAQVKSAAIEEIVVRARKREERLEDTPVSVTVLSDSFMHESGVTRLDDIQTIVPNIIFDTGNQGFDANIKIRGVGTAAVAAAFDPGVGIYVDGVFLPRAERKEFPSCQRLQPFALRSEASRSAVSALLDTLSAQPVSGYATSVVSPDSGMLSAFSVCCDIGISISAAMQSIRLLMKISRSRSDAGERAAHLRENSARASKRSRLIRAVRCWFSGDGSSGLSSRNFSYNRSTSEPRVRIAWARRESIGSLWICAMMRR
jgi:hypothetical protein